MSQLTISELAEATAVSKVALRYYERSGLLPKAMRNKSGYRSYPETAIEKIRFIKNAQSVGFALDEIAELFALQENEKGSSQDVRFRTINKLDTVHQKIAALQKIATTLEKLVASCNGKMPLEECPILKALYKDETQHTSCCEQNPSN